MLKILCVFGTRPEAIKMAPVVSALKRFPDKCECIVCAASQHREMQDQVLRLFGITPDHDLNVMTPGQDLFDITAAVLTAMKEVLTRTKPGLVLVQGDTTTAMTAALAAFYLRIAVGHVEAGLRTGDRFAPYPEEVNRGIISRIAELHFAPTQRAADNLLAEGVDRSRVFVTGNTVIDALLATVGMLKSRASAPDKPFDFLDGRKRLLLVTGHRRENFGQGFQNICAALLAIADRFPDVQIVYPVHLNPNVQEPVHRLLDHPRNDNIFLLEPLDYVSFVLLMERSHLILTDSGGIQEEAPSLNKPVLVMRDTTERPEAIEAGTARLTGADTGKIVAEVSRLLTDEAAYAAMTGKKNPYGDGRAAERIVEIILKRCTT